MVETLVGLNLFYKCIYYPTLESDMKYSRVHFHNPALKKVRFSC